MARKASNTTPFNDVTEEAAELLSGLFLRALIEQGTMEVKSPAPAATMINITNIHEKTPCRS